MSKTLLINTSARDLYAHAKVKQGVSYIPPLTVAVIGGAIKASGNEARCLDMNTVEHQERALIKALEDFQPDYVAPIYMTATFNNMQKVGEKVKNFDKDITYIVGGAHTSFDPAGTLKNSVADIAVVGEGDFSMQEIVSGKPLKDIDGIYFKHKGSVVAQNPLPKIQDLDTLPFPDWDLFDLKVYKPSKLTSRRLPAGPIETSRGCPYRCTYCSKTVCGRTYTEKSTERTLKEMEIREEKGFKELQILDDTFSANLPRAKAIADGIVERKIDLAINLRAGMRVNLVDEELFEKLAAANFYRTSFGIESGSQKILDIIQKDITLDQVRSAVRMAKDVGIEQLGFFMIGLPGETEKTMQKTIDFAVEVDPTIAKMTITTPFPGTKLYNQFDAMGCIKTKDWSKYFAHNPKDVYDHPTLSWDTIYKYYNKFYKAFYFRPSFILRRLAYGIQHLTLLDDAKALFTTEW